MASSRLILKRILIACSIVIGVLLGGCLVIYWPGYFLLGVGRPPEMQLLTKIQSPDGRTEARVIRIIGGPPIGGPVVWQEVQLVKSGTPIRFVEQKNNPGLVLSMLEEGDAPAAKIQWLGPTHLLVESAWAVRSTSKHRVVLGVAIDRIQSAYSPNPPLTDPVRRLSTRRLSGNVGRS